MKAFSNPNTDEKYRKLGFVPDGLSLKLEVGATSIYAIEHPFKGVALTFETFTSRRISQAEVTLPETCSLEQIAGLIYLNVAQNYRDSKEACRAHFDHIGVPLFQRC
jgi:hypothetical protein